MRARVAGVGASGGDISGQKKAGRGAGAGAALAVAALLGGCTVSPTGPEIAAALAAGRDVAPMLDRGRFGPIDLSVFGGPRPGGDPACVERALGGGLTGVDVVRYCEVGGQPAAVYTMHTHGRPWTRLWPDRYVYPD